MARPLRIEYPDAFYHVMNRGSSRHDIFLEDKGRQSFLDLLADITRLWKIEIYAYCLMDNHYHLLLSTPTAGLSRAMRHLDGIYTQKFNRVHHRDGPLFRGRYKAILIDAEEYFLSVVRYIHQNPLAAGVVPDIDRYRWSSHWGYINKKQCPNWLNTGSVMSRFGGLREYRTFMQSAIEEEIEEFYKGPYQKPVLGSKAFIGRVKEKLGERARVEEEKPQSRQVFGVELEEIVGATAREYGKRVDELKQRKRGEENEARMVAIYLSRQLGGHRHNEIGKLLGLEKTSSVSSAYLRMKARVAEERQLVRRVRRIEEALFKSKRRVTPFSLDSIGRLGAGVSGAGQNWLPSRKAVSPSDKSHRRRSQLSPTRHFISNQMPHFVMFPCFQIPIAVLPRSLVQHVLSPAAALTLSP
jgi:putative transposase